MVLKRYLTILAIAASAATLPVWGATKTESTPITIEIEIDGIYPEWDGLPATYLEESLRVLTLAHDSDHLYLMFRFSDQRLAREILHRGVMIWVNGNGKTKTKKEEFALRYRGSDEIAEYFESAESAEEPPSDRHGGLPPHIQEMRQRPGELTIVRLGLKDVVPEAGISGIGAASAIRDEVFSYEFMIPFAEIGGKVAAAHPEKPRKLALGIQIGGLTRAEMEVLQSAMRERMGGMGGMGSMGGGGGGMGGMGGGGGMGGMGSPGSMGGERGGGRPGGSMGGERDDPRARLDVEIEWLNVSLPPVK